MFRAHCVAGSFLKEQNTNNVNQQRHHYSHGVFKGKTIKSFHDQTGFNGSTLQHLWSQACTRKSKPIYLP